MALRSKGRVSDLGAAFAVLTIYMLTLLLPLHQAAGLQRDLEPLGFARLDTWSICGTVADDKHSQTPTAVKCPAAGIGKHEFAAVLPEPPVFVPPLAAEPVRYRADAVRLSISRPAHWGQARAPPVLT